MSKKEMFKKEGKFIPFPGTRDFNPVTGEDLSHTESGIIVDSDLAKEDTEGKSIEEYNNSLVNSDFKEFEGINLIGQKILFRPFKLGNKNKNGFYRSLSIATTLPNTETVKMMPLSYPLQYKGVVCAVSDECDETFKSKVKVGSVITIQTIAWQQQAYTLDRDLFQELEEPFTFWLTPGHIQAVIEDTKANG
jgi:hypothetical protein